MTRHVHACVCVRLKTYVAVLGKTVKKDITFHFTTRFESTNDNMEEMLQIRKVSYSAASHRYWRQALRNSCSSCCVPFVYPGRKPANNNNAQYHNIANAINCTSREWDTYFVHTVRYNKHLLAMMYCSIFNGEPHTACPSAQAKHPATATGRHH